MVYTNNGRRLKRRQKRGPEFGGHGTVLCHIPLKGPSLEKTFAPLAIHPAEDALFLVEFMEVSRLRQLRSSE